MSYSEKLTLNLVYYSKKVYSKVTLDISMKCKNHRGGKNEEPPRFLFYDGSGERRAEYG